MGKLDGRSPAFQWINVLGASGFIVNGWWHHALPVVGLNLVWVLIGTIALIRIWQRQARPKANRE